jgi:hypothetical protein
MPISIEDFIAMEALEERLRTLLPEQYRDTSETLTPAPMGSAPLKYDAAGRVAWNEIWATFCDLAMAGGPPHRGTLLEPAPPNEIAAQPDFHLQAVEEICRGLAMVTGLTAQPAPLRGWVQLDCDGPGMAAWLTRAIVMENVMARSEGERLYLPAGPGFRIGKEIKNVITVTAKTCHYWRNHTADGQREAIGRLLTDPDAPALLEPPLFPEAGEPDAIGKAIHNDTGLRTAPRRYRGWIGVLCPGIPAAVWMMRALVAGDVLARREEAILYLPVNPLTDPDGERAAGTFRGVHRFARARRVL